MSGSKFPPQLRIFLCHSSDDKPAVRKLYWQLKADNFKPWLDEEDLLPGQEWEQEIPKRVRASDVVIVCLSMSSVTKAGYVQKEIKVALDVAEEQPEGAVFIIPLKLEECEVPDRLKRWQWVNFFQENGYERLTHALRYRQGSKVEDKGNALPDSRPELERISPRPNKPTPTRPSLLSKLKNILAPVSTDLAIDCGTTNTRVYVGGAGVVVNEPSVIVVNKDSNAVVAVGKDAQDMLGRAFGSLVPLRPLRDGVVTNIDLTTHMLHHFIRKTQVGNNLARARLVITTPAEVTTLERKALADCVYGTRTAKVYMIENGLCAALGAGLPILEPRGYMIIDIGGGTTDITVICLFEIIYMRAVLVAGNEMDEAITQYIKRKYNLLINERTAEAIKIQLGSGFPLDEPLSMDVRGRNLIEGIPKTITISDEEVREALADSVATIVNAVRVALERIPPQIESDIVERGIVLTGGGALLKNLDKRLSIETGLPVSIADDPLSSVVLGAGKMLQNNNLLERANLLKSIYR